MASRVFVGVGSNIEPAWHAAEALRRLDSSVGVIAVSTFYRTAPLGRPEQRAFLNGVCEIGASVPPRKLKFEVLRGIEEELGRV
ncbi:MAG: 2-amino-4-hydroxy-6-hydroxymethyldihydropteridine diphosphokinase, partial [Planctomycetota bacterium]